MSYYLYENESKRKGPTRPRSVARAERLATILNAQAVEAARNPAFRFLLESLGR